MVIRLTVEGPWGLAFRVGGLGAKHGAAEGSVFLIKVFIQTGAN